MSLTEEQKAKRLQYITGSDASIICGVSPYGNIVDLWQQKLGLAVAEDISHKPAVKAGNYLEEAVAKWFVDETGIEVEESTDLIISKTQPFMAGNIDRWICDKCNPGTPRSILEIKTTSRDEGWGAQGEQMIPDHYLCQVAHYVAVCDVERAYIAVLIRGNDFRWYTYERNAKLEEMIIAKEKAFWHCVQTQTPPTPNNLNEVVSLYQKARTSEPLIATGEIQEIIHNLKETKAIIKEKEEYQKKLELVVKSYMKHCDNLYNFTGAPLATWKNTADIKRFDSSSFEKENEELYAKYVKSYPGHRRFVIK